MLTLLRLLLDYPVKESQELVCKTLIPQWPTLCIWEECQYMDSCTTPDICLLVLPHSPKRIRQNTSLSKDPTIFLDLQISSDTSFCIMSSKTATKLVRVMISNVHCFTFETSHHQAKHPKAWLRLSITYQVIKLLHL